MLSKMDGAFGRNPDIAVKPSDQQFPDLARAPVRLLGLEADNQALDLRRQLVGIPFIRALGAGQFELRRLLFRESLHIANNRD